MFILLACPNDCRLTRGNHHHLPFMLQDLGQLHHDLCPPLRQACLGHITTVFIIDPLKVLLIGNSFKYQHISVPNSIQLFMIFYGNNCIISCFLLVR